jgi:hypothetical protein
MNQTYDYWKDDLRALGRSKDFEAFSSVLDRTTWTGRTYEIRRTPYKQLEKAADHLRRLKSRGIDDWKLDAFAETLAEAMRDAYLRETMYKICRRAGLTTSESLEYTARGVADSIAMLPETYRAIATAVFQS